MSKTTLDLIGAIANGDAAQSETAFQNAMAEKLASKLDDMRVSVSQNMFKQPEVEQEESTSEE